MNEQFSIDALATPAFGWPDRRRHLSDAQQFGFDFSAIPQLLQTLQQYGGVPGDLHELLEIVKNPYVYGTAAAGAAGMALTGLRHGAHMVKQAGKGAYHVGRAMYHAGRRALASGPHGQASQHFGRDKSGLAIQNIKPLDVFPRAGDDETNIRAA